MAGPARRPQHGTPPDRPSRARILSYLLGGYNYTEADRASGEAIEALNPRVRQMVRNHRLFAARATGWAMGHAAQVIDVSAGFPDRENIHDIAQSVRPGARVAYADADPEVTDSWDVLFGGEPPAGVAVARADFRDPGAVLGDPHLGKVIDLDLPVFLLLSMVLALMPPARARALVAGYAERIAPGSYVAISVTRVDDAGMFERSPEAFTPEKVHNFTRSEFAALFTGLELVPPGIAPAANLRPGWEQAPERPPGVAYAVAGIGRKPLLPARHLSPPPAPRPPARQRRPRPSPPSPQARG